MQPRNLKKKDRDKVQGVQDRPASLRASAETPATATEGEEKKKDMVRAFIWSLQLPLHHRKLTHY